MNAQQLRNSILQEAIEGRLVPQDPNDEPASVLLDRIREEKKRLVKEGKLKKKDLEEKPISEDEIPFEIPESWEWVRLGNVCNDISDIDHKMPPVVENGIPYISPLNFRKDGSIDYVNAKKISIEDFKQLSRKCKPERDDLIFPRYGTIGVIRKVDTDIDFLVSYSCATIKPHLKSVDANYINAVLNSQLIQSVEIQRYINKTTQPNVGLQSIKLFLFPLPPLAEQHRIVAKIEELLPKVEEYGKAQDALNKLNAELPERLKKSILQEAISGRLVPQDPNDEPASVLLDKIRKEKAQLVKEGKLKKKDLEEKPISEDEKPFDIPDSWEWCKIGYLFLHSSGKQLKGGDTEGTLHPYITTSNLYWDHFELGNLKSMYYKDSEIERCTAQKGDLLVCEGGDIGRSAIWPYDYNICLQNHVHRLRPYLAGYIRFIYYAMWLYKHTGLIGGKGIAIQGLSASALKYITIPLPPLAEQKRIVDKIEEVFKEIDKLKV
jgi:type I restriction enzyme S subunit